MRYLLLFPLILFASSFCLGQNQDTTNMSMIKAEEKEPDSSYVFITWEEEPRPINLDSIKHEMGCLDRSKMVVNMPRERYEQIIFRMLIDTSGNYVKHQLLKTTDSLLVNHVEPFLPILRFTPGLYYGKPIPFWLNIPFRFPSRDE